MHRKGGKGQGEREQDKKQEKEQEGEIFSVGHSKKTQSYCYEMLVILMDSWTIVF